jgi:hypothetical protein
MLQIGQQVRVLEPFDHTFSDVYSIIEIVIHDDGQIVYILEEAGGFDIKYLEVVS